MTTYLLPKAINTRTRQTVKQQDLTGSRFTPAQRALCQEQAERLARQMTVRTGEPWLAQIVEYTPTERQDQ
jgi:hypothetical protein